MSEEKKNLPAVTSDKKKRPINYAVTRILKQNKFSPLSQLINHVYPQLPPEKQADILLNLMTYVYPKVKSDDLVKRKKGPPIQINTQVNTSSPQHSLGPQVISSSHGLEELLRIAEQSDSKK